MDFYTTLKDLLAPNKAMSIALQPHDFLTFLMADATCFLASLLTIYLVTLAVLLDEKRPFMLAILVMLQIVIVSAIFLYTSIIQLTSNAGAFVPLIGVVISFIPLPIILAPYFMKHCWPPISSRLASCYSRLRLQKMIA